MKVIKRLLLDAEKSIAQLVAARATLKLALETSKPTIDER
jgi:hypothetical protein